MIKLKPKILLKTFQTIREQNVCHWERERERENENKKQHSIQSHTKEQRKTMDKQKTISFYKGEKIICNNVKTKAL